MNEFHRFVRDEFDPLLIPRGYRRKGGSFEKSARGVTAIALFMRYRDRLAPMFNVRLQIVFTEFKDELGVILMQDLSTMIGRGSHAKEWRCPVDGEDPKTMSGDISRALVSKGIPWLESCLDPVQLAAQLESQKRVAPESDSQRQSIMDALQDAGAKVLYQSPGFSAPQAGRLIPNRVRALSFCYQLIGDWRQALTAWNDYGGIFEGRFAADHPDEVALRERRTFLTAKLDE